MIEQELSRLILSAVESAAAELELLPDQLVAAEVEIIRPRQKEHGDFATNVALAIGAMAGKPPREVAEVLLKHLPDSEHVAKVEVAGPGFINFFVTHSWLYGVLEEVSGQDSAYGRIEVGAGEKVLVEFVSANPSGPLHVGHARNAVLGDALANVLAAAGYAVEREYYWNDAGRQMDLFAASVEARYLEELGRPAQLPEEGYQGEYVAGIAREIVAAVGEELAELPAEDRLARIREEAVKRMFAQIEATLERFGIRFDSFLWERTLHETGAIEKAVERLREAGHAYDDEGAVWFRSTEFGDDKDRVLIRSSGAPTYFAADCAYLVHKFDRGFDHLIYVWGADHHGDVVRLRGAAKALGYDPDRVELLLYQFVSFLRAGKRVEMSKRTGEMISLDELLDEVGADAARYTLLTRSNDTALEFDIELVKRQSLDNPVYYVQYAHARIASVIRYAEQQGIRLLPLEEVRLEQLVHETELDVLRKIAELPGEIAVVANLRAPYRLTRYAEELAAEFHRFYTECRVVTEDAELTQARLHLAAATRRVIANVLGLLGVSAPESMERLEGEEAE